MTGISFVISPVPMLILSMQLPVHFKTKQLKARRPRNLGRDGQFRPSFWNGTELMSHFTMYQFFFLTEYHATSLKSILYC